VLKADLPGVAEDKLDVSVDKSILTVTGAREAEERKEDENYSIYERRFGTFTRSFELPATADGERVDAKLEAGVLTLTIGKKAEAKPRKISIKR
jgi:HSP20 family protein